MSLPLLRTGCAALLLAGLLPACAQLPMAEPAPLAAPFPMSDAQRRWGAALAAFDAADRAQPPPPGGVLFVGSSSIRLWRGLEQAFSTEPAVLNRGFGGSTLEDCRQLVHRLVTPYRPRQVLVYAGDNDLAEGRTPTQVLESFKAFVVAVRSELPQARIDFIAIKPSPLRAALVPRAREANQLVASYVAQLANAGFIDIFTPMLDEQGRPRADLYSADQLHMNDRGYALWQQRVAPAIVPPPAGATGEPPAFSAMPQ